MMFKIMGKRSNPFFNHECYPDPTAYHAIKAADSEVDRQVRKLVNVIRDIVSMTDFEIVGRIELKHKKSGRVFK